jgi:hypothetical protein
LASRAALGSGGSDRALVIETDSIELRMLDTVAEL